MAQQKIVPNLWFNGNAEEGGEFYTSVFKEATAEIESRYPTEGLLDFQKPMAGEPLTVAVTIPAPGGDRDPARFVLINAGPEFRPNPSISFMLNFDPLMFGGEAGFARANMEVLWHGLAAEGEILMPLDAYPFSSFYGWVQDRFGVNWQLMLTDPAGDPRPFLVPALMFDGEAQDRAAEAADFYVSLFAESEGGAEVGNRSPYGEPTGNTGADALAFGEFRIGDQWFMASDNGSGSSHGFTPGVSLEVRCADQAEIDRLWEALSAVPAAEQCGWLADRYGVSWQIVPENMDELMGQPGAFEHMLGMKKLIIDDF